MTNPARDERRIPLDVTAAQIDGEGMPPLTAYAFSSGGALLDAQKVDERGSARLSIPVTRDGDAVRVVLGPAIDDDKPDVGELLRRGGIDAHLAVRPEMKELSPVRFEVTPDVRIHILGRRCLVKGTLIKRVVSGGIVRDLPVCNAAVDIWEVDPWHVIIPRLPDFELDRLRPIIRGPWPPVDLPHPPQPPDFDISDLVPDVLGPRALNPQPLPPRDGILGPRALNPQPLPPRFSAAQGMQTLTHAATRSQSMQMNASPQHMMPMALLVAADSGRVALERTVLDNLALLRPILCWLYPQRVWKTRIATVMTDECGHFRTSIWRSILDADVPDLYFTARQRIWPFVWTTIYEPTPVACSTYWDYRCGTEVTLVTRHRAARTCLPCPPVIAPNNWVLFMAIGNTSVWRIHGANTTTAVGAAGHEATKHGLLDGTAPWGGTLRPRLEFDNALRSTLGVHFYRVSFKKPSEPDTAWRFSTDAVSRHYVQTIAGEPVITQYPLGPVTVGSSSHLYQIPPALPPVGQWSHPNVVLDTQSAVIDTNAVAPGVGYDVNGSPVGAAEGGLWQVRVELFDAAGNAADPETLGIAWRVPMSNDLTGTIQTANAATLGLVDTARNCMTVTVNVDNNRCYASIGVPTVADVPASPGCGVLRYVSTSSTVATPFTALHRSSFADYSFYVLRGEGPDHQIARNGVAPTTAAAMPAAPTATVSEMLDGCDLAGFTEQLYVAHRATDGWGRQSQNDASAVRAFVLAQQAPAPVGPIAPIAVP